MSLEQRKYLTVKTKKDKIKQKIINYFIVVNVEKIIKGLYITFAVIRDTALGSGNVLGIQLHNCHINLEFKNSKLKFLQRIIEMYNKKRVNGG